MSASLRRAHSRKASFGFACELTKKINSPTFGTWKYISRRSRKPNFPRIATHDGMDTEHFVKDAALASGRGRNHFSVAVREGIAQADLENFSYQ